MPRQAPDANWDRQDKKCPAGLFQRTDNININCCDLVLMIKSSFAAGRGGK